MGSRLLPWISILTESILALLFLCFWVILVILAITQLSRRFRMEHTEKYLVHCPSSSSLIKLGEWSQLNMCVLVSHPDLNCILDTNKLKLYSITKQRIIYEKFTFCSFPCLFK